MPYSAMALQLIRRGLILTLSGAPQLLPPLPEYGPSFRCITERNIKPKRIQVTSAHVLGLGSDSLVSLASRAVTRFTTLCHANMFLVEKACGWIYGRHEGAKLAPRNSNKNLARKVGLEPRRRVTKKRKQLTGNAGLSSPQGAPKRKRRVPKQTNKRSAGLTGSKRYRRGESTR